MAIYPTFPGGKRKAFTPTMTTLSLISNTGDFMRKQEVFEIKPGEELYLA